ncbi:MAG TPA: hypothetical protein VGJ55_17640, partial [Pyrinomonadaceae bacterium]
DIGPGLTTSDLTVSRGAGQSVSVFAGATGAHGMNFGWDEANQRAFVNAPVQSPITFTHGGVSERMRITTNGNIGIGTTNPATKLDVAGNINASTQYNIRGYRVLSISGSGAALNTNTFLGAGAGPAANTEAVNNSFFGERAGTGNTTGSQNSFFGTRAGFSNRGYYNSFFGFEAGFSNNTGRENTFIGEGSGASNTSEDNNTFIGALSDGAAGITNATAIGYNARVTQSDSLVLGDGVKVGIGTTAPAAKLHVSNTASPTVRVDSTSAIGTWLQLINTSTGGRDWNLISSGSGNGEGAGKIFFYDGSASATRLLIDASGNVGIGANAPNAKLQVTGGDAAISTQGNGLILRATTGPNCYRLTVDSGGLLVTALVPCP